MKNKNPTIRYFKGLVSIMLLVLVYILISCSESQKSQEAKEKTTALPNVQPLKPDSSQALKDANRNAITWLRGQIDKSTGLVISYQAEKTDPDFKEVDGRSWINDNAYAALAFCITQNFKEAHLILRALSSKVNDNSSLSFYFNLRNDDHSKYNQSAALAWVGYSFCFYQKKTGEEEFLPSALKIAEYLLQKRVEMAHDPRYGLIRGGHSVSQFDETIWIGTEHNIMSHFFLKELARTINNRSFVKRVFNSIDSIKYFQAANRIQKRIVEELVSDNNGNIYRGLAVNERGTEWKDEYSALPAYSLGVIFLNAIGQTSSAQQCLRNTKKFERRNHSYADRSIDGFNARPLRTEYEKNHLFDYDWIPYIIREPIWVEGTLQTALAYRRLGELQAWKGYLEQMTKLQNADGGFLHSTAPRVIKFYQHSPGSWRRDFLSEIYYPFHSVAATAWFIIAYNDDRDFLQ
jgi:hypothetical protein